MQVEVTQADREAAEHLIAIWDDGDLHCDDFVQAFAKHRLSGDAVGYARAVGDIVEWLWANTDYSDDDKREYKEFLVNQIEAKFGGRD